MGKNKNQVIPPAQASVLPANSWAWVMILFVIIATAIIRGRLLSVPLERDEGEYAYIAQQMLQGVPPYVSAYSMKLPGIYVVYAMIIAIFGQTQTGIHLGLLVFNAATIVVIFLLTRRFFGPVAGVAAGGIYAVMSMISRVTGLWANAEHFVILPALLGLLLICNRNGNNEYIRFFTAGLLLGLGFIIKQPGIFFVLYGVLYLIYKYTLDKPIRWKKIIAYEISYIVGSGIPFACVCLYFWINGTFNKFWFWTFTYAHLYSSSLSLGEGWKYFRIMAWAVAKESLLILLMTGFGLLCVIILRRYKKDLVFSLGLFIFSFLAICPGFYFREHYFIFVLPSIAIIAGAGFSAINDFCTGKMSVVLRGIIIFAIGSAVIGYTLYDQRLFLFEKDPERVCKRLYKANPFPESLKIANFIHNNTDPNDTVAVIGSEPQIYFYSKRRAATSYIYMYPLMEPTAYAKKMQTEMISQIEAAEPRFLIFVKISSSWVPQTGSPEEIFDWFDSYSHKYYELTGLIEIISMDETIYYWNKDVKNKVPESRFWIAVFKRPK